MDAILLIFCVIEAGIIVGLGIKIAHNNFRIKNLIESARSLKQSCILLEEKLESKKNTKLDAPNKTTVKKKTASSSKKPE